MKLTKLTAEMMVEEVKTTVNYYVNQLGFILTNHVGEEPMIWAQVNYGEIQIMFMEEKALGEDIKDFKNKAVGASVVQFIEVEGVEEFYEKMKNRAEIVQDFHTTTYGTKEFAMKDLNGYVLGLAERTR